MHREAESIGRFLLGVGVHTFEMLHERRAVMPFHGVRSGEDVVAIARGDRDWRNGRKAQIFGDGEVFGDDLVEAGAGMLHQIHLVHRQNGMTDAHHVGDIGMSLGLGQHALARIHQNDGEVRRRGARRHVARVLLVTGRVGDDELALFRIEEAIGHIDGDALLALGLKTIQQQGEVDFLTCSAVLAGIALKHLDLVFEEQLGVIQKSADQGGFAVIHRAASNHSQHPVLPRPGQTFGDFSADCIISHLRNTPRASSSPWSPPRRNRSGGLRVRTCAR